MKTGSSLHWDSNSTYHPNRRNSADLWRNSPWWHEGRCCGRQSIWIHRWNLWKTIIGLMMCFFFASSSYLFKWMGQSLWTLFLPEIPSSNFTVSRTCTEYWHGWIIRLPSMSLCASCSSSMSISRAWWILPVVSDKIIVGGSDGKTITEHESRP